MSADVTEEPGWVYWDDKHGLIPDEERKRHWSPFVTFEAENLGRYAGYNCHGVDRRGRASMIAAAKRAWVKAHPGHHLFLLSRSYSESQAGMHQSRFRYRAIRCDAVTGGRPEGNCSDDLVTYWHGKETPALACGFHASADCFRAQVLKGHDLRTAHDSEQAGKTGGRAGYSTWPYKAS